MRSLRAAFALLACLALPSQIAFAASAEEPILPPKHPGWSHKHVRELPIQSGGRVKPLDSFAREIVLFETGSRSFEGWDPVDMIFSQISAPEAWQDFRFIQVTRKDVRRQLGLDEERSRFSPRELMTNPVLGQYAMTSGSQEQQVSAPIANKPKQDPREQEFRRVFERLGLFNRTVSGEAWTIIPVEGKGAPSLAPTPWAALADHDQGGEQIRMEFIQMLRAYQKGDEASFEMGAQRAKSAIESIIPGGWSERARSRISVEATYNHMRPFLWAWILYLGAALVWILARIKGGRWTKAAMAVTLAGVAFQVAGITMRCYVAGRPPVTNMYESVIWVGIGQMFFALILYAIHRQSVLMLVSSVLGTLCLIAADAAPAVMDPGLHPLVPVLRSNYWLTVHVLTITLGYAAFALTLGLANVSLFHFLRSDRPGAKIKIASMNQLTYRAMQFGVVLLAAGTILGGVWADYSWGRFWGWDPKEVWALIALLCYLAILHGRFAGWVTQFGFAAWSVVSFLSVLMAWYGVNFVLGAGLHSYGFSTGGFSAVLVFIALQMGWVGAVAYVYKRREKGARASNATPAQPATT